MTIAMRSWLFAPGDSERKMEKAIASDADIALLDLEDSVTPQNRPAARDAVRAALEAAPDRARVWVRINPLDTPDAVLDLAAVIRARPGGVFLPKAEGAHHVTQLHHYLTALEAAHGLVHGSTRIAALVDGNRRCDVSHGGLRGRLSGCGAAGCDELGGGGSLLCAWRERAARG